MSEYAQRFAENGIDFSVLSDLTDQDLKDIGVLLGHRRKLLRAIADLDATSVAAAPAPAPISAPPRTAAVTAARVAETAGERRHVTVMFCDLVDSTGIAARLDAEEWLRRTVPRSVRFGLQSDLPGDNRSAARARRAGDHPGMHGNTAAGRTGGSARVTFVRHDGVTRRSGPCDGERDSLRGPARDVLSFDGGHRAVSRRLVGESAVLGRFCSPYMRRAGDAVGLRELRGSSR